MQNKVTKDNFKQVFDGLEDDLNEVATIDLETARKAVEKLRALLADKRKGAEENVAGNSVLKIGIVGQVKAGKSSFLNSLFFNGENVLPRASTPMTAGLTVLQYGDEDVFEVEYYNTTEWSTFEAKERDYKELRKKMIDSGCPESNVDQELPDELKQAHELVAACGAAARAKIRDKSFTEKKNFSGVDGLQDQLATYVGAGGAFTSVVKCLTIRMRHEALRDICIVDTPGVNDPVTSREQRTREFLRSCHGVFFLSYSGHFFDATDQGFLGDRIGGEGIGAVVMVASKFDVVLQQVGLNFPDDIEAAINHCRKNLKSQFDTNMAGTTYNGPMPALTYSSGIGFSIAQKPQSRWDEIETHVVKQMQHFFPSYFTDPDDIKGAFLELSQIEEIREKYVVGTFTAKKDEIIAQKLNDFFATSTQQLASAADRQLAELEAHLKSLQSNDLASIAEKKVSVNKVKKTVTNSIGSLANRLTTKADTAVKSVLGSLNISAPSVATKAVSSKETRLSTFLEITKHFNVTYNMPDENRTLSSVNSELAKLDSLVDKWAKSVDELKRFVVDTLRDQITKAEQVERDVDGEMLNNSLNEMADMFDYSKEVDFSNLKYSIQDVCLNALQSNSYVSYNRNESKEEYEAVAQIQKSARECCNNVSCQVRNSFADVRAEVQRSLETARNQFLDVVAQRKQEFIDGICIKMDERIAAIEKDLQNKEANIKATESALNALKSFRTKL